ncbi:hypothetical protein HPB51_002190 [Rhipicephalus microplus]|uniref:DNA transposase THAP9 n=1 Tax=Rhipicephalus microplus TaxID=6941 RepID=A0A9J6EL41_RHIMP|nr:hypothetical protein HPB51_002190 [Rhipicephalus microplus]
MFSYRAGAATSLCKRLHRPTEPSRKEGFQRMQKFGVFGSGQFAVKGGALRMETACALYISVLSALTALGNDATAGGKCAHVVSSFSASSAETCQRKRSDPKSRDFPAPPGPECSGWCDLPGAENFPEDSPTKQFYKDKVLSSQEEITQLKKKVKTLQQTKRRLVKRNESAQEIIKEIREQKLLSEEGSHVFSSVFSDDIQQLLCRVGNEQKGKYPPELRAFALTLHFYSPAAYEYVRSKFNEALPSQRTLRGWYKSIQGAPGFTAEAFAFLEKFAEARDEPFYCALIVDDMAIRKHVELVGDKVVGYVDFGTGLDDDGLPEAANACVFMIVGINVRFKMPVGYFLIDSLTGAERAELAKQCIEKLALVKAEVVSPTFDGASSNFTMARCLGAQLRVDYATSALTDMRRSSILEPHDDHDYTHPENLSAVVVAVVPYIAGFVVRQVCKTTTCEECIAALYSDELVPLVEQKNRGGLVSRPRMSLACVKPLKRGCDGYR